MAHCVWSYSHNCMANSYHIFSVRDQNGHRLTTLTVQDFFEGKARKIKLIEHKGHHNAAPTGVATKAADQLLAMVNDGKDKLKISWQAIDESKAEFLAQQVDNSVGYDFRNPEQRERVFELYEPCLSRKILRKSHRTFDGFFSALDLSGHIEQFLASRDAKVGGLIASKSMREATRPMIGGIMANNVDQPAQGIQNG